MYANIMKTHIYYKMKYDLQGHQRSDKVILKFKRGSLAHCALPSPSLTLSMPLYLFSLSCSSSLFLFFHPLLPSIPLNRLNNQPTAAADKKMLRGNSCLFLSPPLSFSYFLSMPLYLFSPLYSSSLFLFFPPTLASYPPYASLSFLSPSFFFSLFLTLTYVLMDNFLSLF